MDLAKPGLDVGMFTERLGDHLAFWSQVVLLAEEPMLKLGGGVHQHRFRAGNSVIKVNHSRGVVLGKGCGIAGIAITRPGLSSAIALTDPDGQPLMLVPAMDGELAETVVHMQVSDIEVHRHFWGTVMQLPARGEGFACGNTTISLAATRVPRRAENWKARGWSYLTVQVRDCAAEHAAALRRGAREGEAPRRLGSAAVISFIRDPDGNFIELSQKAELVGPLDPPANSPTPTNKETHP